MTPKMTLNQLFSTWDNLQLFTSFIQFHIIIIAVQQIPQLLATAQPVLLMKFNEVQHAIKSDYCPTWWENVTFNVCV